MKSVLVTGGAAGMVLRHDVLAAALDSVADAPPMIALTPRGAQLNQARDILEERQVRPQRGVRFVVPQAVRDFAAAGRMADVDRIAKVERRDFAGSGGGAGDERRVVGQRAGFAEPLTSGVGAMRATYAAGELPLCPRCGVKTTRRSNMRP